MKTILSLLFTLLMGASSTAAIAAECTSSFYCYGNTGNAVVRVATRPPPIPPPNPRVVQQRRQAQVALRNNLAPRNNIQARNTPAPQRVTPPVTRPTPSANVRVTPIPPAPQVRSVPRQPSPQVSRTMIAPRTTNHCQNLAQQAGALESQAVIASRHNDRSRSVELFKEAAGLRNQVARLNCR